jgi:hypothetical protein
MLIIQDKKIIMKEGEKKKNNHNKKHQVQDPQKVQSFG